MPVDQQDEKVSRVLARFGLTREDLIAQSGESSVWSLDDERILRILVHTKLPADLDYYLRKDELCIELRSLGLPFAVPRIVDHGQLDDVAFTLEERIPGRSLDRALAELHGDRRERALIAFADAALAVGQIKLERPWFGELLWDDSLRFPSWPEYLIARGSIQFERASKKLKQDVPEVERIWRDFEPRIHAVSTPPNGFAHGDYFPGNVMIDNDQVITGVLDFGFSTVIGDPRLDLVGASAFVEFKRPWNQPGDAPLIREYIAERSPNLREVESLYRIYYAFFFAFAHEFGIHLYDWCVEVLRDAGKSTAPEME